VENIMERVLILSPHTDDAELGCGGFICKLLERNIKIFWIVFSTAKESLPKNYPSNILVKEFMSVIELLGLDKSGYLIENFQVRKLTEKRQEVLEILVNIGKKFKPDLVIGPSVHDYHQDHLVVANEMIRAYKMRSSIICYELPWNQIFFQSQFFVKLDEKHIKNKIKILNQYQSQISQSKSYFSKDFIRGLASTRGAQIGYKYAEAFEVIRWIM
jgi:LmbE family N-acetylglucosaminyl deacetylase